MFASKNTLIHTLQLTLLSGLLSVSLVQQAGAADQSGSPSGDGVTATEERRIDRLDEGATEQWEMDLALPSVAPVATTADGEVTLPDDAQNQRLQQLLTSLAVDPGDTSVVEQLNSLLADVIDQANSMMDDHALDQADRLLSSVHSIEPAFRGLATANKRLRTLREADGLLESGYAALESRKVLEPAKDNALYYFTMALSKNPQSEQGHAGLARVQEYLVEQALESARELDFETAESWLQEASAVVEDPQRIADARTEVAAIKQQRAVELEKMVIAAMNAGDFSRADFNIIDLIALGGQEARVEALRPRLKEARVYGGFEPGQLIRDNLKSGGQGPELVIIAAGSFLMGSKSRSDTEKPKHRVTFEQGFALGTREVSVAQFRVFITRTGYRTTAEIKGSANVYDESAGRMNSRTGINWRHDYRGKKAKADLPVLYVSAVDATAYVEWLAAETGKRYRLPSEAEYEYVARAGGRAAYWWGEGSPPEVTENLTGDRDRSPGKRNWTTAFKKYGDGHWGPAPVGGTGKGKLLHPMGVYDITGNVSEWTQDCWHHNYMKAPVDGSAWVNPGCDRHVVRGGYWASSPEQSRASVRISAKRETYGPVVGFRIARDL